MSMPRQKVVVAISGGGRSLANLLRVQELEGARFQIIGVVSSNPQSHGNELAKSHALPLFLGDFSKGAWEETKNNLEAWLIVLQPDLIALAGFLKPFPVYPRWRERTINIHPALFPHHKGKGMYGERVHRAVVERGDSISGATVHFVNEVYDDGAVIAQVEVALSPGDTVIEVAAKVFAAECDLYPKVLNQLASGELPLRDGVLRYRFGSEKGNHGS